MNDEIKPFGYGDDPNGELCHFCGATPGLRDMIDEQRSTIAALIEKVAGLTEALKPFAIFQKNAKAFIGKGDELYIEHGAVTATLRRSDCDRADTALCDTALILETVRARAVEDYKKNLSPEERRALVALFGFEAGVNSVDLEAVKEEARRPLVDLIKRILAQAAKHKLSNWLPNPEFAEVIKALDKNRPEGRRNGA